MRASSVALLRHSGDVIEGIRFLPSRVPTWYSRFASSKVQAKKCRRISRKIGKGERNRLLHENEWMQYVHKLSNIKISIFKLFRSNPDVPKSGCMSAQRKSRIRQQTVEFT